MFKVFTKLCCGVVLSTVMCSSLFAQSVVDITSSVVDDILIPPVNAYEPVCPKDCEC